MIRTAASPGSIFIKKTCSFLSDYLRITPGGKTVYRNRLAAPFFFIRRGTRSTFVQLFAPQRHFHFRFAVGRIVEHSLNHAAFLVYVQVDGVDYRREWAVIRITLGCNTFVALGVEEFKYGLHLNLAIFDLVGRRSTPTEPCCRRELCPCSSTCRSSPLV